MAVIFVTPAKGLLIRDLELKDQIPAAGRPVNDSHYWRQLESMGDVAISAPQEHELTQQADTEGTNQ